MTSSSTTAMVPTKMTTYGWNALGSPMTGSQSSSLSLSSSSLFIHPPSTYTAGGNSWRAFTTTRLYSSHGRTNTRPTTNSSFPVKKRKPNQRDRHPPLDNDKDSNRRTKELLLSSTSSSPSPMSPMSSSSFAPGDKVQVEVISFGPLGATVHVIGRGHYDDNDQDVFLQAVDEPPLGIGLISQHEIAYFRQGRDNVDVVRGEIVPAYIQKVRSEDGKLDIGLRSYGGKAKAQEVGDQILQRLEWIPDGSLPLGDKSTPEEIAKEFPGVSKSAFKKALGALYKQGLVTPQSHSTILTKVLNKKENA